MILLPPPPAKSAFSLVELSIVLVILGLLVGGVLSGQSLIRAAELRAVSTEYSRYISSVQTFRDKYFALPGDMANATIFWGAIDPTPATCIITASNTAATCNGDGDGAISNNAFTTLSESWHFWKHLANAGLVEGTYNAIAGTGNRFDTVIGVNVPASRMSRAGWLPFKIDYAAPTPVSAELFQTTYGNSFSYGNDQLGRWTIAPVLKPEEAWNIDTKLDDGLAVQGKIIAQFANFSGTACTTSANNADLTGTYNLTASGVACSLTFRNAF